MKKELQERLNQEPMEKQHISTEAAQAPDKSDYMKRILALPPEDQAFLDGYLFAKVTEASRAGA